MKALKYSWLAVIVLAASSACFAHVGSPDVYYEGDAGRYHLLVTIRPPAVVPGVAQIEVRSLSSTSDIDKIQILPLTIGGAGESLAPRPDTMQRSPDDSRLYTGNLWIMLRGSWKVQVKVEGKQGNSELDVPVAAVSMTAAHMDSGMSLMLGGLGIVLVVGLLGIVRAANGTAQAAPSTEISQALKRRGLAGMCIGGGFLLVILIAGNLWWSAEARANERMVYHVPQLQPKLDQDRLTVRLENPNSGSFAGDEWRAFWAQALNSNDLVSDHGHLMHLFLVSMPDLKSFWHLHPDQTGSSQEFSAKLPALPPGHYRIYADIVHSTGFPETQVGAIDTPAVTGQPVSGDDSGAPDLAASDKTAQLSDGYRMVWERDSTPLRAQQAVVFRFRVEDKDGNPASGLEPYMGMAGHAVFMSDDGKVFAHVHPEGSVSMAALAMAQGSSSAATMNMNTANAGSMNMDSMKMSPASAEVSFPYGFPQPGNYHIFVQVKRAGRVDTGVFAVRVEK